MIMNFNSKNVLIGFILLLNLFEFILKKESFKLETAL